MGNKTGIQWTDLTWNIATGCDKVDKDCLNCYMYRQSLNNTRYKANQVVRTKTVFNLPLRYQGVASEVWPGNPLVFASSYTDFFHKDIDGYRHEAWDIIRACPHLTFQILTKRPERIMECLPPDWGNGYDNVWLGTSVGGNEGLHRFDELLDIPAKIHFASLEPLHQRLDIDNYLYTRYFMGKTHHIYDALDWVIVGGESGNDTGKYRYRPCQLEWIGSIVQQCRAAQVPVFVKQVGTYLSKQLHMTDRHGGNFDEFPGYIKFRQFPEAPVKPIDLLKL